MQNCDANEEVIETVATSHTNAQFDISKKSTNILARLSNIREEIVKEDKELCKLEDNPSDIPEHTIKTYVKPRKCYSENHESDNFEIGSDKIPNTSDSMEAGGRNQFSFRGRANQRNFQGRAMRETVHDWQQRDRSPNDRAGAFRPMDVFQSRKGRNDRGRSVERENDRDGSDISSGRSRKPESGGKRSKSRERGHSQRTKRSRSNSPKSEFHKALDRWKKFKQSHRVMLDGVQRKKEIYDKRPEDHPDYPEEWRLFWEKRYKELQAQGKEADNHDYKTEWIPYWGKRVQEIYEAEIKVKTESMLHKYELQSVNEPRKQDFPESQRKEPTEADVINVEKDDISAFMGDYQQYRSARGNDDLMIVGEHSNYQRTQIRPNNEIRLERDKEKDYRNERDREHRNERDRERDRNRKGGSEKGSYRNGKERRSRSREKERAGREEGAKRENTRMRGRSPPNDGRSYENDVNRRQNSGRFSPGNQDAMSGLTALENIRDRGISRSPVRETVSIGDRFGVRGSLDPINREIQEPQDRLLTEFGSINPLMITRYSNIHYVPDSTPRLMETLRILTALEDLLGSLGPQINIIMSRAITFENNKEGSANILLEDLDVAAMLQMAKEKLSGQILAGLLEPQKEFAVRNCIDKLTMVLQIATKKRPSNPPSLSNGFSQDQMARKNKEKYKQMLAEQMAKLLIKRGMQNIDEMNLHHLVYEVAKTTPLDDGTLNPPPSYHVANNIKNSPYNKSPCLQGGYSTGSVSEKSGSVSVDVLEASPNKSSGTPAEMTKSGNNELDDLTIDELKSLLDDFKNLSQSEQMDLIKYMKKLETCNPDRVRQIKSSFESAVSGINDTNNSQSFGTDGLGSAMLQVLARNVHSFTNENNTNQVGTPDREYDEQEELNAWAERITATPEKITLNGMDEDDIFIQNSQQKSPFSDRSRGPSIRGSTAVSMHSTAFQPHPSTSVVLSQSSLGADGDSMSAMQLNSNQLSAHHSPLNPKGSEGAQSCTTTSLSNALVAPPPPPPPPENYAYGSSESSQDRASHFSQHNHASYNHPMAEVNVAQSWNTGIDRGVNNQINVQHNLGSNNFGNSHAGWMGPASSGYPPRRGGYNESFRGGVGENRPTIQGPNLPTHYGNQSFQNQNQAPPRYW